MNDSVHRDLHHLGKDSLVTILSLSVLIISLITTLVFLGQRQTLDRDAAGNVEISLIAVSPSSGQVARGGTLTVDVQVNTGGQTLSAADLSVAIPNGFSLVSFTPGNFLQAENAVQSNGSGGFTRTTMSAIDLNASAQTPIPYFSDGVARLGIGAVCDECYLGAAGGGYPSCASVGNAQCYPKQGSGQLARLVLSVDSNAPLGNHTLNFSSSTKAAAIEVVGTNDDNAIDQLNSVTVTVVGGNTAECLNFDVVEPTGTIDTADIQNIIISHHNSTQGDGRYDSNFDLVAPNGVIDTADIQNIIIQYHNTTCLP